MTEQEWINIFGDNLVDILREKDISRRELAKSMNIEESTISRYINKQIMISTKNLVNMSHILGITVDNLAYFDDKIS